MKVIKPAVTLRDVVLNHLGFTSRLLRPLLVADLRIQTVLCLLITLTYQHRAVVTLALPQPIFEP